MKALVAGLALSFTPAYGLDSFELRVAQCLTALEGAKLDTLPNRTVYSVIMDMHADLADFKSLELLLSYLQGIDIPETARQLVETIEAFIQFIKDEDEP